MPSRRTGWETDLRPDMSLRIANQVCRGPVVALSVDGQSLEAFAGESLAAALWVSGRRVLRQSPRAGTPRGVFCMMGACQECLVRVDGRRALACQVPVRADMRVETGTRT